MGIVQSIFCCLCLDDHGDCLPIFGCNYDRQQPRAADRCTPRPRASIAEPLLAPTPLSAPVRSAPTTARSTATQPLCYASQPAVATRAPTFPRSPQTTTVVGPAPPRAGSATSTNLATPGISTPRLQQAPVGSVGQSSSAVRTDPVKRESSTNHGLSNGARVLPNFAREVNGALHAGRASNDRLVLLPPPTISSNQLPRPSETTECPSRLSPAHVLGGSTAVRTDLVKREVASDLSGAALTHGVNSRSEKVRQMPASAGAAESSRSQTSKYSAAQQSNQSPMRVNNAAIPKTPERVAEKTRAGSSKAPIPVYEIPPHLKELIKLERVPGVLKEGLSASNYNEYFACLLYAEDFYLEKWSDYLLSGVTLEFHKREHDKKRKGNTNRSSKLRDDVAFEIDSIPERRPYILSRDFVFLKPLEKNCQRIQGRVARVQKSTKVVAEFEDDFWLQHSPEKRYDVSFSFNRVCLKRAHNAVATALGPVLLGFLFPEKVLGGILKLKQWSLEYRRECAVSQIRDLKGSPPYLIDERHCTSDDGSLSATGLIIDAVIQIYRAHSNCRILICTSRNRTGDQLMAALPKEIPRSQQFRANAAFRGYDDVLDDVRPSCLFDPDDDCFSCPPLHELQAFKVVASTYMSSFRLRRAGIEPGHFTHIFLVGASAATEPEAVVPLANFVSEDTAVVISGSSYDPRHVRSDVARKWGLKGSGYEPWYVRSDMARKWGLKTSLFERLLLRAA